MIYKILVSLKKKEYDRHPRQYFLPLARTVVTFFADEKINIIAPDHSQASRTLTRNFSEIFSHSAFCKPGCKVPEIEYKG